MLSLKKIHDDYTISVIRGSVASVKSKHKVLK